MAPPKRTASPGTVAAITEDLHFVRDANGVVRSDGNRLQACLALFESVTTAPVANSLAIVRDLIVAHTVRICRQHAQARPDDPCVQAAATSLRDIVIQPATEGNKAATVRRRALKEHGCPLTTDGLRKREDAFLREIAQSIWEDLTSRKHGSGPNTVEEIILLMEPLVRECQTELHDFLMTIYPRETAEVNDKLVSLICSAIYSICHVLQLCRVLGIVKARPGNSSSFDVFFSSQAMFLLTLPFASSEDRSRLIDHFENHRHLGALTFCEAFAEGADLEQVGLHCVEWLTTCHSTCAYHRTLNFGMLCGPHQFVMYLGVFSDSIAEFRSGHLSEELRPLLGR